MTKKSLYVKGMFMILIILTLPFYISMAYAQTELTVTRYSGDDEVTGFFDSYDRWVLEAVASVEGDSEITTNQVKINEYDVQECSLVSDSTYKCSYESAYYSLAGGTYPSTVNLFSDANVLLKSQDIEMTLDNLAPVIEFDRLPLQNASIVSVAYTLKDQAWKKNDFSKCSGPARVEFWDNGVKLAEENISASDCAYSSVSYVPLPSTGNLILKAFDRMGHIATASSPRFELDSKAPEIRADSLKMFTQGIELQKYIPSGSFPVTTQIKIIENKGLQAKNVIADFSQFGEGASIPAVSCLRIGQEYTCTWPAMQMTISTGTYNIKITATDDLGNKREATAVKSFAVDTSSPNVISVGTRNMWQGISYIGNTPAEIVAVISEAGAGLAGRQALMDLSEIDAAYSGKYFQANICEKAGANWECVWGPVTSNKPHRTRGNIYIIKIYDDAGNEATGVKQGSIFIDRNAPSVQELTESEKTELGYGTGKYYAKISPIAALPTPILSSGDDMIVNVQVKDDSEVKAFADFSRIMGSFGYENVAGDCKTDDNINWNCAWEIGPVGSGYLNEDAVFTFVDSAGNNETVEQKVEVFAKDFEESPDYWTAKPKESMPRALDRATTPLINHNMYFPILLKTSTSAELISADLVECTGDTGYADNIFIFNNERGSKKFFIGIWFKAFDPPSDYLKIKCTLNLQSTYNKRLLMNYEKESVKLAVRFYDSPLGEASLSLKKEIKDEVDKWIEKDFWKAIGFLNKIFEWSNLLCKTYYTWRMIVSIFDMIEEFFSQGKIITEPQRFGMCLKTEIANKKANSGAKFFDKFCGFINCKLGPLPLGEEVSGLEHWGSVLGGGGGLAGHINTFYSRPPMGPSFKSALGGFSGTEDYSRAGSTGGYLNVKDNLVLSLLTLCIPGIIYNLQKLRGIHCTYINCLITSVQAGVSTNMCAESKSYQECKYIWGPIFQLLPYTGFYNYVLKLVRDALSDPLALLGVGFALGCVVHCPKGRAAHKLCIFIKILSTLGDALTNIKQIRDKDAWKLKNDPCIALEEKLENESIEAIYT